MSAGSDYQRVVSYYSHEMGAVGEPAAVPLPVVSVVGPAGAGKTALLEKLVRELGRRGYRVACVKHSHHTGLLPDLTGSDTERLARAGAQAVGLAAPGLLCLRRADGGEWPLAMLASLFRGLADLLLTEGYRSEPTAKVLVATERHSHLPVGGPVLAVVGPAPEGWAGPTFDPDDVEGLARFLEESLGLARRREGT